MLLLHKKPRFKRLHYTLMTAFLVLSLVPLTVISLFFLHTHSQALQEQSHSYLVSMRDTTHQQLTDYISAKESEVMGFVRSELAYASGGRFYGLINAFKHLGSSIEKARHNAQQRYIPGSGDQIKTAVLRESDDYVGSERYRLMHKRYHWAYNELLKRSDFDDILLVDLQGNVSYSVLKNDQFGTNLLSGRYQGSALGDTFRQIQHLANLNNPVQKERIPVYISDFTKTDGISHAWFAAPIIQQDYLHSYALLRLPLNGISKLIKNDTSAVYTLLAGPDLSRRSLNIKPEIIELHSEILKQGLTGNSMVTSYSNRAGEKLIAAFSPVQFKGLNWALSVQLPERVAYARVHQLEKVFIAAMLLVTILVFLASHFFSGFIAAPLLKLTWAAEKLSAGDLDQTLTYSDRKDELGRLALSFERMRCSIREKLLTIQEQNEKLENSLQVIQHQNQELQLADKLKDEFLATTSHELKTPLHGMIGIAEALMAGSGGQLSANLRYQLEIIVHSGQRLSGLIDDLLDYHKIRYGTLDLNQRATDLFTATSLVLQLSTHLIGTKRLRIINQVPIGLPAVLADPQRLEQVLYNLIGNAISYTREGKVVISVSQLEHHLRIEIVDTGQGIPAEQLEYLFEPLSQPGSGCYRQDSGLGLSVSRQLIELMGGTLYVSSQPQAGTTFSFTLPLATDNPTSEEQKQPVSHFRPQLPPVQATLPEELPENSHAPLILAADNDPVNLRVLESFLRLEGYRVKTACEASEVLRITEQEKPALLLLDLMLPGMSGYQLCQALRSDYPASELPIIMLTSHNQSDDRVKGFEAGANDYLSKPFNKQELAARVKTHQSACQNDNLLSEISRLKQQMRQGEDSLSELINIQNQLLNQLDSSPEAIICLNAEKQVCYSNQAAARLFQRTPAQLQLSNADELIASSYLHNATEHYCGAIDIFIRDQRRRIQGNTRRLASCSGLDSMFVLDPGVDHRDNRLRNLETAVDALSDFASGGNSQQLEPLKQLGGEFRQLAERACGEQENRPKAMRETLVNAMTCALSYWQQSSGKSKFAFAEESGLWRVYLDRSTLQTRTLDKYLRIETLPKTPRWRTVLSSIDFILDACNSDNEQRHQLEQLRLRLNKLVSH